MRSFFVLCVLWMLPACAFVEGDPELTTSVSSMIPKQNAYGSATAFMNRGMRINCEFIARGKHAVAVSFYQDDPGRNWTTDHPQKLEVVLDPEASSATVRAAWPGFQKHGTGPALQRLKQHVRLRFKEVTPGEKISFRMGFTPVSMETSKKGTSGPWRDRTKDTPPVFWDEYTHTVEILTP